MAAQATKVIALAAQSAGQGNGSRALIDVTAEEVARLRKSIADLQFVLDKDRAGTV